MSYEIRLLVEQFYDIQKLRIETFNRLVSWTKEKEDSIILFLNHSANENQTRVVNQILIETQSANVNHTQNESHAKIVNQTKIETQNSDVNHYKVETQVKSVNHRDNETHGSIVKKIQEALELLKKAKSTTTEHKAEEIGDRKRKKSKPNKSYAEFTKKFVANAKFQKMLSQIKCENQLLSVNHGTNENHATFVNQGISEIQRHNVNQSPNESHVNLVNPFSDVTDLLWYFGKLKETEKELKTRLDIWSSKHPVRQKWLDNVVGIGPVLSSGLLAWLEQPIKNASHATKIWSYCGLAPGQKREKGKKLNFNLRLKTFTWKIGESFVKKEGFGRQLYDSFKAQYDAKHDVQCPKFAEFGAYATKNVKGCSRKGHIHAYAKRKATKIFLANFWEVVRRESNLPVSDPYPIEILGHVDIVKPERWVKQ